MAAAHVLHFGARSILRGQVLRDAGYMVEECENLPEMAAWFRLGHRTDLVCISENPDQPAEGAIALARTYSVAPVVLFRAADHPYLQQGWDLEIAAFTPPQVWLSDVARLLDRTRANVAESRALQERSRLLWQGSERARKQSEALRANIKRDRW